MKVPAEIEFRRSTRLTRFDYRSSYAYFVTICVRDRACVFGSIASDAVSLSRRGIVARDCWLDIPNHHPHVELDAFVIMPNHMHGILLFVGDAPLDGSTPVSRPGLAAPGSLGAVVGSYKAAMSRTINRLRPGSGTGLWQPNYYDHVIRSDRSRDRIRDYIDSNPLRWAQDAENPSGDGTDTLDALIRSLDDSPLRGDRDAGVAPTRGNHG
jgi:REP element-mobilizing transposase RayT